MKNIAIFASGSGTNAENIARYFTNSENVNVAVVLSNNRNVGVHGRVNKLGVPSFVFSREEFIAGVPILEKLAEYDVCLIVLAGFMNKISDVILQAFPGKIVNIHPALLPKYGGKGMYGMHVHEAVVKAGERESGITIHYINEHYATYAQDSATNSSEAEVKALVAERSAEDCYMAEYMTQHIGEQFDGIISGVTNRGLFVQLTNSVEGFVPIDTFVDSEFEFDGMMTQVDRLTGDKLTIGMPICIQVVAADVSSGRIDFMPASEVGKIIKENK